LVGWLVRRLAGYHFKAAQHMLMCIYSCNQSKQLAKPAKTAKPANKTNTTKITNPSNTTNTTNPSI
jgi:hypothetical protein